MKKNENITLICFIVLSLAVLAALFYFSGQDGPASQGVSQPLAKFILQRFKENCTAEDLKLCNYLLRRLAHFTLFMLLGIGLTGWLCIRNRRWRYTTALMIGSFIAVLNEVQQIFSGGRNASAGDVLLDLSGFITGCVLNAGLRFLLHQRNSKK